MGRLNKILGIIAIILQISPGSITASEKITVFVSLLPQKYFVQQIGKQLLDVQVMVPPGSDPHTYEPKPQQMVAMSRAKLYFAIGIEFEEANLTKIIAVNPNLKVVHTDEAIEKIAMPRHRHEDQSAGEHDVHVSSKDYQGKASKEDRDEPPGLDPHVWLSPPLVKMQAQVTLTALKEIDPANSEIYERNFKEFTTQIDQLDSDLKEIFAGKTGLRFMVFHPSWGYFANAYGLKQVPIEMEGKDPKPAQLKHLIEHARELEIKVVFVQPQFSTRKATVISKEIGGQVVFTDPLAYDWMANLREVADKFRAALK